MLYGGEIFKNNEYRKKVLTRLDATLRSSPVFDTLKRWGGEGNEKMGRPGDAARRDWLQKNGIQPSNIILYNQKNNSKMFNSREAIRSPLVILLPDLVDFSST